MADTILIKRGQSADLPSASLQTGEPGFALDTKKLYINDGTTDVLINPDLPTNVSELTNDSGYITSAALPTNVSELTNDEGYIKATDAKTIDGGTFV